MAHRIRALTRCAALTLQLLSALALATAARAGEELLDHQRLARDLLSELIEIDTTHSSGDTTRAAKTLAAHLATAGFAEEDAMVLEEVPGKGNLVARLRGSDSSLAPVLLLAHLDVVEADPPTGAWTRSSSWSETATTGAAAPRTTRMSAPSTSPT